MPYEQYAEARDGRTWTAFLGGCAAKGLLPFDGQFAHGTLRERNDALAHEFERTLPLTAVLIPRFPVELAEVVRDKEHHCIRFGEISAETEVWTPESRYADSRQPRDYGLDPRKEYAIVTELIPDGSLDKHVASFSETELNGMIGSVVDALAVAHYHAFARRRRAAEDPKQYDSVISDMKYAGLDIHVKKAAHNEDWDGGAIARTLSEQYIDALPSEKQIIRYLQAVNNDWPVFSGEMFSYGSYVMKQLASMDVRQFGDTIGDPKLSNIYRRRVNLNGKDTVPQYIILDPIGKINDPVYSKLYYQQEGLADLAHFLTDLEAHLYDTYGQLETLAHTVLDKYLSVILALSFQLMRFGFQKPSYTEADYDDYFIAQYAKLQYYCAAKARVGAIGTVVRDAKPELLRAYLLICAMHMRQARELNARYSLLRRTFPVGTP